jgi:hypothetical protein
MAPRLQRWDLHTTKPNCEPPVAPLGPFLSPLVVATVVGNSGYEPAPLEGEQEPETLLHVPVQHFEGAAVATRLGGVVGLMLLVTAASLLLAVSIYQLVRVANQVIQGFMGH